jgi:hypothetical protein
VAPHEVEDGGGLLQLPTVKVYPHVVPVFVSFTTTTKSAPAGTLIEYTWRLLLAPESPR